MLQQRHDGLNEMLAVSLAFKYVPEKKGGPITQAVPSNTKRVIYLVIYFSFILFGGNLPGHFSFLVHVIVNTNQPTPPQHDPL